MPFPEVERVVYSNSPLVEVICQLRFPSILRISAEDPYDFQDRVRDVYPKFGTTSHPDALPEGAPEFLKPLLEGAFKDALPGGGIRQFHFSDPADEWNVFLSRDALGLTTSAYTQWEDFRSRFITLVDTLVEVYNPAYFTRIGLRYKDLLSPERAGKPHLRWTELLMPPVLGEIGTEALQGIAVVGAKREIKLELESDLFATLSHGFVDDEGQESPSYLIDADYFKEGQIDTGKWLDEIERSHSYAGRVFRWYITDTLHDALGPVPLANPD